MPILDRHFGPEPAFGDELAVGAETDLSGHEHEIPSANERDVVGNRGFWLGQGNAQFGKLLFHGSSHDGLLDSRREHSWRRAASAMVHFAPIEYSGASGARKVRLRSWSKLPMFRAGAKGDRL